MRLSPEKLALFEKAVYNEATDDEACAYARVTPAELQDHIVATTDEGWYPSLARLRSLRAVRAAVNLGDAVDRGDVEESKWLLERRMRDMYGKSQEELPPPITYAVLQFRGDSPAPPQVIDVTPDPHGDHDPAELRPEGDALVP
jgi:hypothetical protein